MTVQCNMYKSVLNTNVCCYFNRKQGIIKAGKGIIDQLWFRLFLKIEWRELNKNPITMNGIKNKHNKWHHMKLRQRRPINSILDIFNGNNNGMLKMKFKKCYECLRKNGGKVII